MGGLSDTVTRRLKEYQIREPVSNLYRYARDPESGAVRELPQPWGAAPVSPKETRPTDRPEYKRMMILAKKEDQAIKRDYLRAQQRKGEQIAAINFLNEAGINDIPEEDEDLAHMAMSMGWKPRRDLSARGGILDPGLFENPYAVLAAKLEKFFNAPDNLNQSRDMTKFQQSTEGKNIPDWIWDEMADRIMDGE